MNPSSKEDSSKKQWSEHSFSASAASMRDEEQHARQQQHYYHAQLGNASARPDSFLPRYVDHTYRDFSHYIKDGNRIEKHKKSDRNFPALLHGILSNEQYSHIISWMPHGRAWKIKDKQLLMEEVVPEFFGQSKYASFARQLSGWGFKRLHQTGPDFGCYYHECFLRGHPRLTVLMRRVSPGQGRVTPNMNSEPDFYLIDKQYPLGDSEDAPDNDNGRGLENNVGAPFSGNQKMEEFPGDAASEYEDFGNLLSRKAAAPNNMMLHQQQWDPFDQLDSARRSFHEGSSESAVNHNDSNSINPTTKRSSQRHSFSSVDADRGDDTKPKQRAETSVQEVRKYDPFSLKYQQQKPNLYRDRGNSDPFPMSSYHLPLDSNSGYAMPMQMHSSYQDYYGANVNQYAYAGSSSSHQAPAAGYYYPPPQYAQAQQHDAHSGSNMSSYDYWYRNPYYNYSNNYPQAYSHLQPEGFNRLPPHPPAQAVHDHNSPNPLHTHSPSRSLREDEDESHSKPQP